LTASGLSPGRPGSGRRCLCQDRNPCATEWTYGPSATTVIHDRSTLVLNAQPLLFRSSSARLP
jgi:hypothetical protein